MKNGIALWALLLIGCASTPKGSELTVNEEKMDFIEKQLASIGQIAELHKKIKDIDISVGNLYPIAVVDDT
ncbi:MAG: hypothetical protein LBS86_03745, partial [Treponema sp.]|nr:hypothetical protein [Treponema sp.]